MEEAVRFMLLQQQRKVLRRRQFAEPLLLPSRPSMLSKAARKINQSINYRWRDILNSFSKWFKSGAKNLRDLWLMIH